MQAMVDVLGLDICADTIIGNAMRRGVSGGQKKRVTTGTPVPLFVLVSILMLDANAHEVNLAQKAQQVYGSSNVICFDI